MQGPGKSKSTSFIAVAALAAVSLIGVSASCPALAQSGSYQLLPLTKLRLTVVQFMPTTGDYRRWDAVGGELTVGQDGTIVVPTLGRIPASNLSPEELAGQISAKLQAKLGLVDRPDATVDVVEYPPVFLVGSVTKPGEYPFRPGMTVLEAVAIGGGQFRGDAQGSPTDTIRLQSELQGLQRGILRSNARLARLRAELAQAKEITFPPELDGADPAVADILSQEQTIFSAHQNELTRQVTALNDLTALYRAEIDVLGQKSQSIDQELKQAMQQQAGIKQLVEKGVATMGRQADVDRQVAGLRSDRLDNMIATMTAQQGLNEATRNIAKLEDDQHTEVSVQLQDEEANLERLQLNQTTNMRLLRQATEFASDADKRAPASQGLSYTILRQQEGQPPTVIAASETTALMPGDLLKVNVAIGELGPSQNAGPLADASLR